MDIGIPKEQKIQEGRVALVPDAVAELLHAGHKVFLCAGAGLASGYADESYREAGATIMASNADVYDAARVIVKVKEPTDQEVAWLKSEHLLFCYLHLAANTALMEKLLAIGLTAIAFETVPDDQGRLPLLAPMSDIAGRLAVQIGTCLLHQPQGGKGVLLGGLPGASRGHVVVVGGGVVGSAAVEVAAALGARVTVFDRKREKLAHLRSLGSNVTALYPYRQALSAAVRQADLLVGAVLITGAKAPHVISAHDVRSMDPGGVVVDVAVDQGGCIETIRPTNYAEPTYLWEGIVHFAVTNMPGAVPRSASQALSAVLLPYVLALSEDNWDQHAGLHAGVNVAEGTVVYPALVAKQ